MTNTTNTPDLRAALTEARDWFESQAKAVSKGCGSSYELHDLRVQRDALDATLTAAPAQPAPISIGFKQFLADVHTAAGLVRHGKQCKALADRLGSGVMEFQAPLAPLTDEQIMAASEYYWADDIKDFTAGVKFAERHHNIIK